MNPKDTVKFVANFLLYAVASAAVICSLTYAAHVISTPSPAWEQILALLFFVTSGAVVFNGILIIQSSIETYIQSTKETENNDEQA